MSSIPLFLQPIEQYLRNALSSDFLYHLVMAAVMFFAAVLLGWIAKRFLTTVGRRIIDRTASELDNLILNILLDKIKWIAVVTGAYLASEEIAKSTTEADITARQLLGYANGIIFVCFVIVVTIVLIRIVDTSIKQAMERHARRTSSKLNEALLPLINRVVNILLATIALIIVLDHFGQDVSSLVVSLGVGSLAIALAAQDTLANMIAGFVIMLDRPFRVGDRIQLPSGEVGDVYEIGIRSTKILDFDNNLIVSPNADLIKGRVVNYSYPEQVIRVVVEVGVAYGTELDRAKLIMTSLAKQHPDVLEDPLPEVFVVALADSSVNLRLVARTDDFRKKFRVETTLREQIYNTFRAEGIEIPFPQRVVYLANEAHGTPATVQSSQKRTKARR
jgi:small-conductance mechanosensitive channel